MPFMSGHLVLSRPWLLWFKVCDMGPYSHMWIRWGKQSDLPGSVDRVSKKTPIIVKASLFSANVVQYYHCRYKIAKYFWPGVLQSYRTDSWCLVTQILMYCEWFQEKLLASALWRMTLVELPTLPGGMCNVRLHHFVARREKERGPDTYSFRAIWFAPFLFYLRFYEEFKHKLTPWD